MNKFHSISVVLAMSCAILPTAFALGYQPDNGFLIQADPVFMNLPPVPEAKNPTLTQEIRADNLQIHQEDTLEIGAPTYSEAHRLLIQNLRMMERQTHFGPVDLAKFNGTTHPSRFTVDQTSYVRDDGSLKASERVVVTPDTAAFFTEVVTDSVLGHTYAGAAPSRRTIVAAAEESNRLRLLANAQ